MRTIDESQPCLIEQVFSDIAAARQAREEAKQARIEFGVYGVERASIAGPHAPHELELEFTLHFSHNALDNES